MLRFFNVRNKSITFEKYFVRYPLLSIHYHLLALHLILSTIIIKVASFPVNTSFLCGQKELKISIFIWSQMYFYLIQIPPIFEVLMCWFWSTLNIKCIYRCLHIHFLIYGFFESVPCQRKGRKNRKELGKSLTCSCFLILPHYKKLLVVKREAAFPWDSPWGAATL